LIARDQIKTVIQEEESKPETTKDKALIAAARKSLSQH